MIAFETKIENPDQLINKFRKFPTIMPQVVYANFVTLGIKVTRIMQHVLEPARFKGRLEGSVSSEIDVAGITLEVGPTAEHALYTFYGTRPHWAPIEPLKEWARVKLGDEGAAYAIQKSIARYGTSRGYLGIKGNWIGPTGGIGLDFLRMTTERGDFKSNVTNTARRLGADLVTKMLE